jgi:hypothetical protein
MLHQITPPKLNHLPFSSDQKINSYTDTVACYIKLGPKGQQLLRSRQPVVIHFSFLRDASGACKAKPAGGSGSGKYRALDESQSSGEDEDEDGEEANGTGKAAARPKKAGGELKELEKRCVRLRNLVREVEMYLS